MACSQTHSTGCCFVLHLGCCCCFERVIWFMFLAPAVLDGVERLTAEEMDERRQQNMAYEYLCHLEEAKR